MNMVAPGKVKGLVWAGTTRAVFGTEASPLALQQLWAVNIAFWSLVVHFQYSLVYKAGVY